MASFIYGGLEHLFDGQSGAFVTPGSRIQHSSKDHDLDYIAEEQFSALNSLFYLLPVLRCGLLVCLFVCLFKACRTEPSSFLLFFSQSEARIYKGRFEPTIRRT